MKEAIIKYPEIEKIDSSQDWLEEFFTQPFIKEFSWNIIKGFDIHFGPFKTAIMGLVGSIANILSFSLSLSKTLDLSHTKEEILTQGLFGNTTSFQSDLEEIGNFINENEEQIQTAIVSEIGSCYPGEYNQKLSCGYALFTVVLAVVELLKAHPAFWVLQTILTIASIYLPSFLTGIDMLLSGLSLQEYRGIICLLFSDYSPILK